jgi:hypothetical protein
MIFPAGFYAYMTTSTADRSDAATWGSRQPPPPHVHGCDKGDRAIMTAFTSGSDARTDVYKRFLEPRTATLSRREVRTRAAAGTATIAVATTLPAIPAVLAGARAVHVARKTLTIGAS